MSERFEHAVGDSANIGGKPHAEKIEGVNYARGMAQPEQIDAPFAPALKGLQRRLGAIAGEITQEGVAGAERQKPQFDSPHSFLGRKNAINDFVGGAVSTYRQKFAVALIVGLA